MQPPKSEAEAYSKKHPKRDVAMVGFQDESGHILLTRTAKLPQSWHAIGGGIDPHDVSPKTAAIREVKEELGLELLPHHLTFVLTAPYDFGEGSIHYFSASLSKVTELAINQDEIVEHRWFSLEQAIELPMYNATRTFLHKLHLL